MSTVITVAQRKGGAGKTTLVIQLATAFLAAGREVAVVDIDPQASLTAWMRVREHRREPVLALRLSMIGGWRLGVELDRLKRDADLVLVDTPPHAETEARTAVRAADLVLIPVQPSPLDVWASNATFDLARRERRQVRLVLNRMPPRGRAIEETMAAIRELGARPCGHQLGARTAFVQSVARGLGVVESEPRGQAAEEVRALAAEIAAALA